MAARQQQISCAGLMLLAGLTLLVTSSAAAYIPDDDTAALQQVPSPTQDPRVRHYLDLRARFDANSGDMALAQKLAHAYIDFGRHTGDIRYLGYAQAVIRPWMNQTTPPVPIQVVHATILQSRHRFAAARGVLQKILERAPDNAQAWLTLATVALVQGDVAQSNKACIQTAAYGGFYLGTACTAQLRVATGHADQVYALLSQIEGGGNIVPAPVKAWIEGLMADAASYQGKTALAQRHFKQGLAYTPGDNFLLADYADFLLDNNRPQAVLDLLQNYTQSDTSFLRRVLAEAALNTPDTQRDIWAMGARFAAMDQAGSHLYRREQSRFVLHLQHDPGRALALAKENWRVQRAPWDARVYLEAALAAKRPQAAQPVLEFIQATHMSTPHIDALVKKIRAATIKSTSADQP